MRSERQILVWARAQRSGPNPQADERILSAAQAALDRNLALRQGTVQASVWRRIMQSPITKLAVAAALIVGVLVLAGHLFGSDGQTGPQRRPIAKETTQAIQDQQAELAQAKVMYQARDIEGLNHLLDIGVAQTRIQAAQYLAEVGDGTSLARLQVLAATEKQPQVLASYAEAMEAIKQRLGPVDQPGEPNRTGPQDTNRPASDQGAATRTLGLEVVDKDTNEPVAGASVEVENKKRKWSAKTDGAGRLGIGFEEGWLAIVVAKPGYVPMRITYRSAIPETHLLRLGKGTEIGGYVETADGRPVSGGIVKVSVGVTEQGQAEPPQEYPYVQSVPCRTDGQGQWACDVIPANPASVILGFEHEAYVYPSPSSIPTSIELLRTKTHLFQVAKAVTISGQVVDQAGSPVSDASVYLGQSRYEGQPGSAKTQTDPDGRFTFNKQRPGSQVLTVVAKGRAQDMKVVEAAEGMEHVVFVMEPGHTVVVRVADPEGHPIQGAEVEADEWRSGRDGKSYARHVNIRLRTDTDGHGIAVLMDAPGDEVRYRVRRKGFIPKSSIAIWPDQDPCEVTMTPAGRLTGMVYDAQTNGLIKEFSMTQGSVSESRNEPDWRYWNKQVIHTGQYELVFNDERMAVRIEAEGYVPGQTGAVTNDGTIQVRDLHLTPVTGRALKGTVWLPDGSPAQSAEVAMAVQGGSVTVEGTRFRRDQAYACSTTDANGVFSLPVPDKPYSLVAVHTLGLADATQAQFEQTRQMRLGAWGRVEGQVDTGTEMGTFKVSLDYPGFMGPDEIAYDRTSELGKDGRFIFDHVRPGKAAIGIMQVQGERSSRPVNRELIEVTPGRTTEVTLSEAGGITLIGWLTAADGAQVDWRQARVQLFPSVDMSQLNLPAMPIPEDFFCQTDEQRESWLKSFMASGQGMAMMEKFTELAVKLVGYDGVVEPNGLMRVARVMPGLYDLIAEYTDTSGTVHLRGAAYDIRIAESGPAVIEAGLVVMLRFGTAEPNQPGADFEVPDLAGGILRLSKFRGRFVLLELGGPAVGKDYSGKVLPVLQQIHELPGVEGRLEIVSLALMPSLGPLDMTPQMRYFARQIPLPMHIGLVEMVQAARMPALFMDYPPGKFVLIDPEGKVAAIVDEDKPDELVATVTKAMERAGP